MTSSARAGDHPAASVQSNSFGVSCVAGTGRSLFTPSCKPLSTSVINNSFGLQSSTPLSTTPLNVPVTTTPPSSNPCATFATLQSQTGSLFGHVNSLPITSPPISGVKPFSPQTFGLIIPERSPAPISTTFTSKFFSNDSCKGPYTSIPQTPFTFYPTKPLLLPDPSIISSSAGQACTSGQRVFESNSSAPYSTICNTFATAPVTTSVHCNISPTISNLDAASPFTLSWGAETPPAVSQMSNEGPRTTAITSKVASDRPSPARNSSSFQIKYQLPTPKFSGRDEGPKVSFSSDAHNTSTTARKEASLMLRDNTRAAVPGPSEERTLTLNIENISGIKHTSIYVYENGEVSVEFSTPLEDGSMYQGNDGKSGESFAAQNSLKPKTVEVEHPCRMNHSTNAYEVLPKLKHSDYFTEPRVEELAIRESFTPGFCSHVKDFVVGRHGYGSVKILGYTDVRQLDINSHFEFKDGEVIVHVDESKKPAVGQGLNKAAEITLCNIKCVDEAGNHYKSGSVVEKFKLKLMVKAAKQGAMFLSYDPVKEVWKFSVGTLLAGSSPGNYLFISHHLLL